jgi:hypothetical protein
VRSAIAGAVQAEHPLEKFTENGLFSYATIASLLGFRRPIILSRSSGETIMAKATTTKKAAGGKAAAKPAGKAAAKPAAKGGKKK